MAEEKNGKTWPDQPIIYDEEKTVYEGSKKSAPERFQAGC